MGYIKEPCFSSHDPYFICSPYYKGCHRPSYRRPDDGAEMSSRRRVRLRLRLFRLEELRGNAQRNRTLPVLRHPSSLRPRRGWALLNTHHAPYATTSIQPHTHTLYYNYTASVPR